MNTAIKMIVLSILLLSCDNNSKVNEINEIIKTVKKTYIKDTRLEYINVSVVKDDNGQIKVSGATSNETVKNELIDKIQSKAEMDIELLPSSEFNTDKYAIMKLSVIPIRRYPKHSAEQIDQAIMGSILKLYQKKNGWYLIQTDYDYFGWVPTSSVVLFNEEKLSEWKNSNLVKYTGSFEFVTSEKNGQGTRLVDVGLGNVMQLMSSDKKGSKVKLVDGREGYLSNEITGFKYLTQNVSPDPNQVLDLAKTFLGLPYLWGGNSTKGVDCSGFTQTVFKNNGFLLPRDADQQSFTGEKINPLEDFSNIKKGDLLFFGPDSTDIDYITHVAISLGGYDFIHSSGEVKMNSFDKNSEMYNEYLLKILRKVRRVIN